MAYSSYSQQGPFIAIPPTTDLAVVFPYDKSSRKFDRSFYSPALTDGRVSSEQVESFLRGAERIIKKKSNPIRVAIGLFVFFVLAGFLGMFCIVTDDTEFIDDDAVDDVFTYIMGYFCFLIFGSILLQYFIRRKQRKAKKGVKSHIKKHAQVFAAQGVRWNAPLYFPQWIELWKDYKGQGQATYAQAPIIQAPNSGYMLPQQPQAVQTVQTIQPQQVLQNNVNSHPVPRYQSNNASSNNSMTQPLLSQQQQIEMGAFNASNVGGQYNNL